MTTTSRSIPSPPVPESGSGSVLDGDPRILIPLPEVAAAAIHRAAPSFFQEVCA